MGVASSLWLDIGAQRRQYNNLIKALPNFCRIHQRLRLNPAMEAAIADHVWTMAEIVALIG